MKKIIVYVIFTILLCFFIPIIFTVKNETLEIASQNVISNEAIEPNNTNKKEEIINIENSQENNVQTPLNEISEYDYKEYNTIKLLHTETNEIEEINLDKYLCGVISAEMPATYDIEALKAQAIVARTYTLYKIKNSKPHGQEIDICDNYQCCQAWLSKEKRFEKWDDAMENEYWNKIILSINETKGKVIKYNGEIINAFFHANSGGKTEMPVNVWGGTNYPYLQVIETAGEEGYTQYSSEIELTLEDLKNKLKENYADIEINQEKINSEQLNDEIKILEYTESGRVRTVKIGNKNIAGTEIRKIINLKSTNFEINIDKENSRIKFLVIGYGHGIGMSQTGADAMAKSGSKYDEIIKHFYTGVEIVDI